MTRGEELIEQLHIPKDCTSFISFVYKSSPAIYIIAYNSQRKNQFLTKTFFSHYADISFFKANIKDELAISPFMTLKTFNGARTGTYLVYDLAFAHMKTKENVKKENMIKAFIIEGKLNEITLADLKDKGNIAPSTLTWRQDRNKILGSENTTLKFIDVFLNEADDSVTFAFQTQATPYKDIKNLNHDPSIYKRNKKRVSPLALNLMNNPEKKYEIQLKILNFFSWLDTHPIDKEFTLKDLKEILQIADIQIFNTSPGFHWQGINYWASQLDASAYPTNIKPTVWDKRLGGEYFVDKHTYGFLQQINFFLNPMASMLNTKLKGRGII